MCSYGDDRCWQQPETVKILVAASSNPEPATTAARFPWPPGSEIRVISVAEVIQPVMVGMIPDTIDAGSVQVRTTVEASKTANEAAQRFRNLGFRAEGIAPEGDTELTIVEYARKLGRGSHRGGIARLLPHRAAPGGQHL